MTLRLAAGVWTVLVLAVAGRVAIAPARSHSVTPIYWSAAERFVRHESLYQPVAGLDLYLYPPGFAATVVPFTWVPEKVAGILWRVLGAGLFLAGMVRLGRDVLHLDDGPLAWLLLLPIPLVIPSLDNGQANVHMAGVMSLGVAAVGRSRPVVAAGWFAFAVGIKLYPVALGMLVGLVRPRMVPGLLVLAAAAILVPFATADADYVRDQFRELVALGTADDRTHSPSPARVPKDWTVLARTWAGWVPNAPLKRAISAGVGIGFAGLVVAARRKPLDRRCLLAFVLGSVWMTLFGPATEPQTYTLLAPALAATVLTARGWPKVLAVAAWWLFTVPVIRDAFPNGWRLGVLGPQPLGAMALTIAAVGDVFAGVGERGWSGDSVRDGVARRDADGFSHPLYVVPVGSETYLRKGGRR